MKIARAGWVAGLALTLAWGALAQQPASVQTAAATAPNNGADIRTSLKEFSDVFGLIQKDYADPVNPNLAIYGPSGSNKLGAIPAMLRVLDPHSNFFDPKRFAQLEEE